MSYIQLWHRLPFHGWRAHINVMHQSLVLSNHSIYGVLTTTGNVFLALSFLWIPTVTLTAVNIAQHLWWESRLLDITDIQTQKVVSLTPIPDVDIKSTSTGYKWSIIKSRVHNKWEKIVPVVQDQQKCPTANINIKTDFNPSIHSQSGNACKTADDQEPG